MGSGKGTGSGYKISSYASECKNIQSTLLISKSKGPFETLRDIRNSAYQICRTKKNAKRTTKFPK